MPYKLLVADSSPSALRATQLAFAEACFEVYSFEDGMEVMNSIQAIDPDLALIGLSLSTRDGYEVARFMRSRERLKDIPVWFLKGAFETIETEKMAGLEPEGVIQKPFDSERLVREVKETIGRKKGPLTLPEESAFGSPGLPEPAEGPETVAEREPGALKALRSPEFEAVLENKIRESVKREVLEVERELEKRIRARVLAELGERDHPVAGDSKAAE